MPALTLHRRDPKAVDQRDPAVFAPRSGCNYALIAETAWVDVQIAAIDILDMTTEAHTISDRLQAGVAWFREHGATNPQYIAAQQLRNRLNGRFDALLLQLRIASVACWFQCCVAYAALQHVSNRATWLKDVADDRFDGTSPQGIWLAVLPKIKPAGSWPLESSGWIERRMSYTEVWAIDERREHLEART